MTEHLVFVTGRLAKALLEKGHDRDNPEPLILKALGKLYYDAGELSKAAELFELGRKQDKHERAEQEAILETYLHALGMI